jgi:2'-5' RNA ligase
VRLFVALVPPESLRANLEREVAHRRGRLPRARWVRAEHLHLTLAFLGEVAAAAVAPLAEALRARAAGVPAFTARLAGAGAFPPHGPVRVIWAGLEPEADLARLAAAVRAAIDDAGLAADDKPFRAHLTLARCPQPWRAETRAALVGLLGPLDGTPVAVDRTALVESVLGPGGPTYRDLARVALGSTG